jgi:hypothetical protein
MTGTELGGRQITVRELGGRQSGRGGGRGATPAPEPEPEEQDEEAQEPAEVDAQKAADAAAWDAATAARLAEEAEERASAFAAAADRAEGHVRSAEERASGAVDASLALDASAATSTRLLDWLQTRRHANAVMLAVDCLADKPIEELAAEQNGYLLMLLEKERSNEEERERRPRMQAADQPGHQHLGAHAHEILPQKLPRETEGAVS